MSQRDGWHEIEAVVPGAEVDVLSGELWAAGASGVEERPQGAAVRLVVAVRGDRLDAVRAVAGDRWIGEREVPDDEGLDEWRRYARPVRVGALSIEPAWLASPGSGPNESAVRIDPGRAFGSGAHVTTRLALELLAGSPVGGARVLDLGTGSGVLAIAAARLGATAVVAVDDDEGARTVAMENVKRNGVGHIVEVDERIDGGFDVVVANITAPALIELGESVVRAMRPTASLILSGILVGQERALVAAYDHIVWTERTTDGDWVARAGRSR